MVASRAVMVGVGKLREDRGCWRCDAFGADWAGMLYPHHFGQIPRQI